MSNKIKALMETHIGASNLQVDEQSFALGVMALKKEIEHFVENNLKGKRHSDFAEGQDDGLRWVLDHLHYILKD